MRFASFQNSVLSRSVVGEPEPFPGMEATVLMWTDRRAATVKGWDPKSQVIEIQYAKKEIVSGHGNDGSAKYVYEEDPNGRIQFFKKDQKGIWHEAYKGEGGRWKMEKSGRGLVLGYRDEYYDPSF